MADSVRRIVTGHDADGKAVVVSDERVSVAAAPGNARPARSVELWMNRSTPADLTRQGPPDSPLGLQPPAGGAIFRVVWFAPESEWRSAADAPTGDRLLSDIGARDPGDAAAARHPMMHRTDTIDYAVIMSGECTLMFDDSEVTVHAGDTVIQLGNNHAWVNRSGAPCQIAFIMIDGMPL